VEFFFANREKKKDFCYIRKLYVAEIEHLLVSEKHHLRIISMQIFSLSSVLFGILDDKIRADALGKMRENAERQQLDDDDADDD
jgi:hypothetical protein